MQMTYKAFKLPLWGQLFTGEVATLDDARGYRDNLQTAAAFTTDVAGLARGADTGLSNVFNNLQVSTAGAEFAAQEADQSLQPPKI